MRGPGVCDRQEDAEGNLAGEYLVKGKKGRMAQQR